MMHLILQGAARPLIGDVTVPGDKSIGHRAVLLAALATGRSRVRGLSGGEDNRRTAAACQALGVGISGNEAAPDGLRIDGRGFAGLALSGDGYSIDCGNSGTTMRLLAGVLAGRPFATRLTGDRYLEGRPMKRVAVPLGLMGAMIRGRRATGDEIYPPLVLGPQHEPLRGIDHATTQASAQVKSALLLAGLQAEGVTCVREPALSRDHTERMLRAQGAPLEVDASDPTVVRIDPQGWDRRLAPLDITVPGDLSSAAFLLGAAAIVPGSVVTVRNVGVNQTRTGVLDALAAMGAALAIEPTEDAGGEPVADLTVWGSPLAGIEIAGTLALRCLDELPLLAAVAAHADGDTVIRDARELRVKESDRIKAMVAALRGLGVAVEEVADGMTIHGRGPAGRVPGGRAHSHGDHRIAMASAVCALFAEHPSRIDEVDNIATSFPGFVATLQRLGGELQPGADD